jgi:hypothetical protein
MARAYFQREIALRRTGKATRRETTNGFLDATAASVWA